MKSFSHALFFMFIPVFLFAQQFTRIESGPVVSDGGDSRAVNWIDYDNDGDLDLFITNGPSAGQNNFFYENNGDGTFNKLPDIAITNDESPSDGSTWADFNNDGHADLFVANWWGANNLLYINNGDKTFTLLDDTSSANAGFSESASWADVNGDAFVDLFVANSSGNLDNFVFMNSTTENFSRIAGFAVADDGGSSRHMDFADYDNDGVSDLFIPNENGEKNFLYRGLGDGNFIRINEGDIVNNQASSFGSSWGDYDNDGDLDLFVANFSNANNYLYKNNGNGTFDRVTEGIVVNDQGHSIGTAWADVDNDGDLDLFVANGFSPAETTNFLYYNNGDGTFTKDTSIVSTEGGWSYGAGFGDFNRDGYLDLAVAKCFNASENNALYQNSGGDNNWLTLKLKGTVSNRSAIGAVAKVKATIDRQETWQMRHVSGQNGYCGQNLELHFGLGDAAVIDSLIIKWPSGQIDKMENISVNQFLQIEESIPQGFLRPHFKAHRRVGFGKDTIQFKDLSVVDPENPITFYEWDFNGDGISDNQLQNPAWQYDSLGNYSVELTVSNGANTFSKLFADYINIQKVPGVPVINSLFPAAFDTTIAKREEIMFTVSAKDTSDYTLNYSWFLNGALKSSDTGYSYRASSFNVPRTDTVNLEISNGYNISKRTWYIHVVNEITALEQENQKVYEFNLKANYPNPFNPSTTIQYTVGTSQELTTHVKLVIYDLLGRQVATLVNKEQSGGHYRVSFDASDLSSGVYYYQMRSGPFNQVKQMLLLR